MVTAAAAGAGFWWASQDVDPKATDHVVDKQDRQAEPIVLDEQRWRQFDELRELVALTDFDLAAMDLSDEEAEGLLRSLAAQHEAIQSNLDTLRRAELQAKRALRQAQENRATGRETVRAADFEALQNNLNVAVAATTSYHARLAADCRAQLPADARGMHDAAVTNRRNGRARTGVERFEDEAGRLPGTSGDAVRQRLALRLAAIDATRERVLPMPEAVRAEFEAPGDEPDPNEDER